MPETTKGRSAAALLLVASLLAAVAAGPAQGRIVCWKDKSGKIVGCGDNVPPEYLQSATTELDNRGITRKTTESAEDAARHRAQREEQALRQAEERKRAAEVRRRDNALLNTYSNVQEIDAKRDRDLQTVELRMKQMQALLKNATRRYSEAKVRLDAAAKSEKPVPQALKDDVARAAEDKRKAEASIAAKNKGREAIRRKYAEQRERYIELTGGPAAPSAPAAAKK